MSALIAVVKNGRLVLDAPTGLPEGTTIELVPADERPPESVYEPVSVRDLELVEHELAAADDDDEETAMAVRPSGPPAPVEESISPRAPARSVIARRHLSTLSQKLLTPVEGTPLAAKVREASARAAKHLRQLEAAPEGENYLTNANLALACTRETLSLLQTSAATQPALVPAAEEIAEAVGLIFSLLS